MVLKKYNIDGGFIMSLNKKIVSVLLAGIMLTTMVAGCGKKEPVKTEAMGKVENKDAAEGTGDVAPDISKEVNLKFYLIGDEGGPHANEALDYLNGLLKETINAKVEPLMIGWGDWKQKLPITYASGEAYDLIYTSDWTGYYSEASKGPFMDITELFPKYAPETYAEMEAAGLLDSLKIDGKLYMVPTISKDYTYHAVVYREDLRKKYNVPEITDLASLEVYLDVIKANEPDMLPFNINGSSNFIQNLVQYQQDWARPLIGGEKGIVVYDLEEGNEAFNIVDTPEYEEMINLARRWSEKGYWSKSVLSEKTSPRDQFYAGKSALSIDNIPNLNNVYSRVSTENPDWELGILDLENGTKIQRTVSANNGVAIGVNSKNPERALMFIEQVYQNPEVFYAAYHGIEGVNYEVVGDKVRVPDRAKMSVRGFGMALNKQEFVRADAGDWDKALALRDEFDKVAVFPALAGFIVDESPIAQQIAAVQAVNDEYKTPLALGLVDPKVVLPELRAKLKAAGIDEIVAEVNKQISEFKAAK